MDAYDVVAMVKVVKDERVEEAVEEAGTGLHSDTGRQVRFDKEGKVEFRSSTPTQQVKSTDAH